MAFLYNKRNNGILKQTGQSICLAGYNLIYQLWIHKGKPTDQGWHISAEDLIGQHSKGKDSNLSAALIIDFDPRSKCRIGLIELLGIYLYTYSGATREYSGWSPMMLKFRNIFYEEYDNELTTQKKKYSMKYKTPKMKMILSNFYI